MHQKTHPKKDWEIFATLKPSSQFYSVKQSFHKVSNNLGSIGIYFKYICTLESIFGYDRFRLILQERKMNYINPWDCGTGAVMAVKMECNHPICSRPVNSHLLNPVFCHYILYCQNRLGNQMVCVLYLFK